MAQGIKFAVDHGASVINLSLGESEQSATLLAAIQYANARNVVVVAAAGNDPNTASFPASYPQVISVGATTADGTGVADFSSKISRVDLAAPGENVLTSWWDTGSQKDGWAWVQGTSFATPMVAGTVALLKWVNPNLTVEQVRSILTGSAHSLSGAQGSGAGQLDSGEALRRALLPAYAAIWQPADRPVSSGAATRSWEWGPASWFVGTEDYAQPQRAAAGRLLSTRAAWRSPTPGDRPLSTWYVTNGLLVKELISGQMQVGPDQFVARGPAQVKVAGDPDDSNGPT